MKNELIIWTKIGPEVFELLLDCSNQFYNYLKECLEITSNEKEISRAHSLQDKKLLYYYLVSRYEEILIQKIEEYKKIEPSILVLNVLSYLKLEQNDPKVKSIIHWYIVARQNEKLKSGIPRLKKYYFNEIKHRDPFAINYHH